MRASTVTRGDEMSEAAIVRAAPAERVARKGDAAALWALIVVVSPVSEIAVNAAIGAVPPWLIWLRIAILAAVVVAGQSSSRLRVVRVVRVLRGFALGYLYMLLVAALMTLSRELDVYRAAVAQGFTRAQLFAFGSAIALSIPFVAWCWRRRDRFYLRAGNPNAPVLRFHDDWPTPLRWSLFAPVFAVVAAAVTWLFVTNTGEPVPHSWAMVPWAVFFAFLNSFFEELLHRVVLVGATLPAFGKTHAVLASATIFAVGHWNGLPAGVLGVLMTFALGYVAARALVETRGIAVPWVMHWAPDCVLFYFWGIGSVAHATLGGMHS
jgi:membrane protease YdiL (CAAX protease family)